MKMNTATKMIKSAVYLRKSSEDERSAADGRSIDRQREHAVAFAQRQGWRVAQDHIYVDDGISGANFQRPGLVRLLEATQVHPRPFDALIVMSIDRIGRHQGRNQVVVQQLHDAGVQVWCYQDGGQRVRFDTPSERLMVGINSYGAEEYRYQVRLKTVEALRRKAARGHVTGARTFGFDNIRRGDHTERVINSEQAATVRRIFEWADQGFGDGRIMNRLSSEGVPAPGRGWTKTTIRRILRNKLYVGTAVYSQTETVDDGARGKRVRVLDPERLVVAQLPDCRVVDQALWDRVQARKAQTRAHYMRSPDGRLMGKPESSGIVSSKLLNGILKCGECGSSMVFMGKVGAKSNRYYCLQHNRRGNAGCTASHGAPMAELHDAVLEQLWDTLFRRPETVAELCEARVERMRREQEAQAKPSVEKEVAKLESEIKRLVGFMASGKGAADLGAAVQERRDRIEALQAAVVEPPKFDRAAFFEEMRYLSGAWMIDPLVNPGDPVLVRQVLRRLGVDRVTVRRSPEGEWSFESALDAGRAMVYRRDSRRGRRRWC